MGFRNLQLFVWYAEAFFPCSHHLIDSESLQLPLLLQIKDKSPHPDFDLHIPVYNALQVFEEHDLNCQHTVQTEL